MHIHCNAQDIINIKIKRITSERLIGCWDYLLKSKGNKDTVNFDNGYYFTFYNSGVFEHREAGKVVENGNWKLQYDTLILSNRAWHMDASSKTLDLYDREEIIFTDKDSFFIKIKKNKEIHIIMFRRRQTENTQSDTIREDK